MAFQLYTAQHLQLQLHHGSYSYDNYKCHVYTRAELQFPLLLFSMQLLFCMLEAVLAIAGKRAGLGGLWSGTQAGDKTDA